MPVDDLLRFVYAPLPFPIWWFVAGVLVVGVVIVWYVAVFVWTLPPQRLRRTPILRVVHAALLRRRFSRSIRRTCTEYQEGALSTAQACAVLSRTVRSFLFVATGARAQYLHVSEVSSGDLASAGPLLAALGDAQFRRAATVDVAALGDSAGELVRQWT